MQSWRVYQRVGCVNCIGDEIVKLNGDSGGNIK